MIFRILKESKSLRLFLQSYLQYRKRPYESDYASNNNEKLIEMDFMVFKIWY